MSEQKKNVWKKFCCYPPCLREAVLTEGVLIHPFEVVHIEQIGPPAFFFIYLPYGELA